MESKWSSLDRNKRFSDLEAAARAGITRNRGSMGVAINRSAPLVMYVLSSKLSSPDFSFNVPVASHSMSQLRGVDLGAATLVNS